MNVGVAIFPTDLAIRLDELGRETEQRGFESLFVAEHTHIPTSRRSPYPGGGDLPDEYKRTNDPFVALSFAAAHTTTLKVGTGICLAAQHHPINLAKSVASLDYMSNGRFVFGVGFGWNVDEMEDHGVDPRTRWSRVRETVEAAKALWTQDVAGYAGKHITLPPSWQWPKPVQQPHPPNLVGGSATPLVFKHVVEWADGWMPIGGRLDTGSMQQLQDLAAAAGRTPPQITVFTGRLDAETLETYAQRGADRVVSWLPPAGRDTVLRALDRAATTVRQT